MRLGYAISVSGAAPDTLMLTKFDVLPIRFLLYLGLEMSRRER